MILNKVTYSYWGEIYFAPVDSPNFDTSNASASEIHTGPQTVIGNRSCHHVKVDIGLCALVPGVVPRSIDPYTIPFQDCHCPYVGTPPLFSPLVGCAGLSYSRYHAYSRVVFKNRVEVYQACSCSPGSVAIELEEYSYRNSTGKWLSGQLQRYTFVEEVTGSCRLIVDTYRQKVEDGDFLFVSSTNQSWSMTRVDISWESPQSDPLGVISLYLGRLKLWASRYMQLRSFGDLSNDCATTGGKAVQAGTAQYLIELNQLANVIGPFRELIGGKWTAKAIASAWLSYNYGARQTAADTYNLISGIVRESGRRVMDYDVLRAIDYATADLPYGIKASGYRALTVYYRVHEHWITQSYAALRRWNLNPSLSLAWDLVPLSFVVDWFLPIGDALQSFDGRTFLSSLDIIESISTQKTSYRIPGSFLFGANCLGEVTVTTYDRLLNIGVMPKPTFQPSPCNFTGLKVLNGTSLAVQRFF